MWCSRMFLAAGWQVSTISLSPSQCQPYLCLSGPRMSPGRGIARSAVVFLMGLGHPSWAGPLVRNVAALVPSLPTATPADRGAQLLPGHNHAAFLRTVTKHAGRPRFKRRSARRREERRCEWGSSRAFLLRSDGGELRGSWPSVDGYSFACLHQ